MKRCLGCMQTYDKQLNICPHCGYAENTSPEEAIHMTPGTILQDRFIIGKVVGCGGFGVTYIAWDKLLDHKVAIKEYLPSEFSTRMPGVSHLTIFEGDKREQFDDGMKKFLDEARRLAKFQNESGIVKIFDCFEENKTAYIVMEYLQGITLTQYLEEHGQIQEDEAVKMILPILNSLKSVHREGIIHRDIAPDNIMVTDDGQVKLIDFGAARYATTSHSRSLTVIIKQGYSPVEQYQSRGNQGAYTDVYAIGAVLYRMITGVIPPDSMERNAYFENSHKDILDSMHKCVKGVSENKENAILNAMNIRIEDRSPDMDSLIKELTTDEPVARINGKIKKKDILKWPLWLKLAIPTAMMAIIALLVLFITGVIGFDMKKPREIAIPDGMTRVPRIVSMDEESAKKELHAKQLNYLVVGIKNDETIDNGCVLTQNVSVGSLVAINYSVEVMISAGTELLEVPFLIGISKENAIDELKDGFAYEIVEEYDSVIESGYVTNQSIDGGTEVDKGTLITLTVSKGRNPEIEYNFENGEMPNLVGLTLVEAINVCEKLGIKLVVGNYEYSSEYDGMCVLEQDTVKGTTVEKDMVVEIVLSKGTQVYKVPSILYLTEEEAIEKLSERDIKYELVYEENETVAEGCVASQSISSDTVINKDEIVKVVISTGPPKFDMIDVLGMTEADAITALQDLGLVVVIEYKYDNSVQSGIVLSQSEDEENKVNKGYEIVIVVSSSEELVTVPNVEGKTYENAKKELETAGFIVGKNEVYSNSVSKNTVISQTPSSGSGQKKGTKIVLNVSLGKEIVSDSVTEEPTISTIPSETEKVTEKETETSKVTQATTQKPTEITTQEETTEKLTCGFIIPEGCYYYQNSTEKIYYEGEEFCEPINEYDKLVTSDYEYIKDPTYCWQVKVLDTSKSSYEELMGTIWGIEVRLYYYDFEDAKLKGTFEGCTNLVCAPDIPEGCGSLDYTFRGCSNLVNIPIIPSTVTSMERTFEDCISLEKMPNIPENVKWLNFTFMNCTSLISISEIPKNVEDIRGIFYGCTSLKEVPYIPEGIKDLSYAFYGCTSLVTVKNIPSSVNDLGLTFMFSGIRNIPPIPETVTGLFGTFTDCYNLTGNIVINANPTEYTQCFAGVDFTAQNLTLSGTSTMLDELRATGLN